MNELQNIPKADVSVRDATLGDVAFIDALQKVHREQVGFMHRGTLEGKIAAGHVLIAEDATGHSPLVTCQGAASEPSLTSDQWQGASGTPVGYCIGTDRYFKHDDVGIIYHLNVSPGKQRSFVGATLLKAMFDRASYGCKLFCCWCAQDIAANKFWESMGFVPLAYRAGSEKRRRVHIFWQKRIREGDVTTPWWFPAKTDAGAMGADRIVLPIPPGMRWSDELPLLITQDASKQIAGETPAPRGGKRASRGEGKMLAPTPPPRARAKFGPPGATSAVVVPVVAPEPETPAVKPAKVKRKKVKADPVLVAKARELRDRYLEHVNSGATLIESSGKYDVVRALSNRPNPDPLPGGEGEMRRRLLPAA